MNPRLLDPAFLLEIYETIFRILIAIALVGIVVEFVCLMFLSFHEGFKKRKGKRV